MGEEEVTEQEIDTQLRIWSNFVKLQVHTLPENRFVLNPDTPRVRLLAKGVLSNEKNHGLKYCPCRITTGERFLDLKLICPCNFQAQRTWREKGECWCSLFVKANKKE